MYRFNGYARLIIDGNLMDGLNHQHPNIVAHNRNHIQVIVRIGTEMKKPTIRRLSLWDELIYLVIVKEIVDGALRPI